MYTVFSFIYAFIYTKWNNFSLLEVLLYFLMYWGMNIIPFLGATYKFSLYQRHKHKDF